MGFLPITQLCGWSVITCWFLMVFVGSRWITAVHWLVLVGFRRFLLVLVGSLVYTGWFSLVFVGSHWFSLDHSLVLVGSRWITGWLVLVGFPRHKGTLPDRRKSPVHVIQVNPWIVHFISIGNYLFHIHFVKFKPFLSQHSPSPTFDSSSSWWRKCRRGQKVWRGQSRSRWRELFSAPGWSSPGGPFLSGLLAHCCQVCWSINIRSAGPFLKGLLVHFYEVCWSIYIRSAGPFLELFRKLIRFWWTYLTKHCFLILYYNLKL